MQSSKEQQGETRKPSSGINLYARQEATVRTGHGITDWFQTGKGQFSFQSQRKAMPKSVQTTAQLHSSHTLAK